MNITIIKSNTYMDSIFLMGLTRESMAIEGVANAVIVMGTDMNKTVLADVQMLTGEAQSAEASDLIIALQLSDEAKADNVRYQVEALLKQSQKEATGNQDKDIIYPSLTAAKRMNPCMNLAYISIPGDYAGAEAQAALEQGMNVFLFSDNVPIEEEVRLKGFAQEHGLVVMGPGCGNAVLNGVAVGMMSKVSMGSVGIVGASGSGIHEIAMLLDHAGLGVTQAIGTGGRDLSEEVGGITMLQAFDYLNDDPKTKVIVLVSKPPHPETAERIYQRVRGTGKPVIIYFLGAPAEAIEEVGAHGATCLEEAATKAISLVRGDEVKTGDYLALCESELRPLAQTLLSDCEVSGKYLRGVFCGGTHSEEAILMIRRLVYELHSNVTFGGCTLIQNPRYSIAHSIIDIGDEIFTKGKPHPVIDPTIMADRLQQEAKDPDVAVILFDLLLGYGVHEDPAGCIEEVISNGIREAKEAGRKLMFVGSLCGTKHDPQNFEEQWKRLEAAGAIMQTSNARAAILAGMLIKEAES